MENLEFSTVLKSIDVKLKGEDGVEKIYHLKELNGDQRAEYQKHFDVKLEVIGEGDDQKIKATPGEAFKLMTAREFLCYCFYDSEDKLVPESEIGKLPSRILESMHTAALKLSGMDSDSVKAKAAAKNG